MLICRKLSPKLALIIRILDQLTYRHHHHMDMNERTNTQRADDWTRRKRNAPLPFMTQPGSVNCASRDLTENRLEGLAHSAGISSWFDDPPTDWLVSWSVVLIKWPRVRAYLDSFDESSKGGGGDLGGVGGLTSSSSYSTSEQNE